MSNAPDYGAAFATWRANAPSWPAYTEHAFVRGLTDGSLPREAFLHYLKQDYVFLLHFARAWALAVAKSDTLDEMNIAAGTVNALVNEEMQLHVGICREAGIDETALAATVEREENLAYTRYVLEAGYSGDLLDLLAALAPCVFGYGEIGRTAARNRSADTYSDWIDTYAGDDYQGLCRSVGQLIDMALARRLGEAFSTLPRFAQLGARFETATRLEVGFWDMGLQP
ncbi:MAG: TenA family protein [Pseudomonadota bacterium]